MEEEQNQHWEQDVSALVKRYETMMDENASWYFDVDQFEAISEFYLETGQAKKALNVLQYGNQIFPDSLNLTYREAQVYAGIGMLSKAIKRLKAILMVETVNEDALLLLGNIYSQQRDHKRAVALYRKALENMSDAQLADDVFIDLALEYENMGQYDKAIEVLKEALDRNQENETAIYELAYCFDMAGQTEDSIAFYKQFIEHNPFSFTAWYNLGNSYQKKNQLEDCIEAYDFCLAIEPDFSPASFNRANALVKQEKFGEAIVDYNDSLDVEGPQSVTFAYIGECYEKLGDYDEAIRYYKKALAEDAGNAEAHIGLGVVYDVMDRPHDSLRHFRKVLELQVDDAEVMTLIVTALRRASYFEEAIEVAQAVLEDEADNVEMWLELVEVLLEMGSDKEIIYEVLDDAYAKTEFDADVCYRKVALLYLFKDKEEAFALLEFALKTNPEEVSGLIEYLPELTNNQRFLALHASYKN